MPAIYTCDSRMYKWHYTSYLFHYSLWWNEKIEPTPIASLYNDAIIYLNGLCWRKSKKWVVRFLQRRHNKNLVDNMMHPCYVIYTQTYTMIIPWERAHSHNPFFLVKKDDTTNETCLSLYNATLDSRPGSYNHHTTSVLFIGLNSPFFLKRKEKNNTIVMSYTRIKRMRIYMRTKKRLMMLLACQCRECII